MDADTWDPDVARQGEPQPHPEVSQVGVPPQVVTPPQVAPPVGFPQPLMTYFPVGKPRLLPRWAWVAIGLCLMVVASLGVIVVTAPKESDVAVRVLDERDWEGLDRYDLGTTKVFERDEGNWELTVNSVDWLAGDLPGDLQAPPPRTNYIAVNVTARDLSYNDSSAWVSFHFDYLTLDSELYPEALCHDGCLPTVEMNYMGEYTGTLYFLVPSGTTGGYLYVDSRVNTEPNVLMMLTKDTPVD